MNPTIRVPSPYSFGLPTSRQAGFQRPIRPGSSGGFSLIEICVSLSIISFAFVGLLGLVPIGLQTVDTAVDATVASQITQRVASVARQTKFSELSQLDRNPGQNGGEEAPDFFFDEQGTEVVDAAAINHRSYIYRVAVTLQPQTALPSSAQTYSSASIATVNLFITRISAPKEARLVSLFIANNGQ